MFSTFRTHDGPVNDYIMDSDLAPDGSIWFATSRGVSRQYQGKFTNYTVEDGLPARFVFCLETAANGDIWAGTYSDGVGRFDGEKWTKFSIEDGLVSKSITSIAIAPDGAVWCGSPSGWPSGLCYTRWQMDPVTTDIVYRFIHQPYSIGPPDYGSARHGHSASTAQMTSFTTKDGCRTTIPSPLVLTTIRFIGHAQGGVIRRTIYCFGVNAFKPALDIEATRLKP